MSKAKRCKICGFKINMFACVGIQARLMGTDGKRKTMDIDFNTELCDPCTDKIKAALQAVDFHQRRAADGGE